jgi:N-acetyl-gamma-glutamyl-phosphate reductase
MWASRWVRPPPADGPDQFEFEKLSPAGRRAGCDIVLLGLPHKVSAEVGAALLPTGVKIVDMSGDFRLRDAAAYERYYGARHPTPTCWAGSSTACPS